MTNFTQNNHLKYSIGGRLFGYRETVYDKYKVSLGQIDIDRYKKTNWLQEQYRTAELIRKEFGKELVVMFSGGTDSEIVLRAFKEIGIVPRAVFIRFTGNHNIDDHKIAIDVTNDIDIPLEVVDFDVVDYVRSGQAQEFAKSIQCSQIAYLGVFHNINKMQMPAVMGGEILLKRNIDRNRCEWYYCFRENEDASAMRFSIKYKIPLVNEWFSYTPEMIGHFLEHPGIEKLVSERFNYKLTSVSSKNAVLQDLMPSILKKKKTHGFEKLMAFNGETYHLLQESMLKDFDNNLNGIFLKDVYMQLFGDRKCLL